MRRRWTAVRVLVVLAVVALVTAGIHFALAERAKMRHDARTSDQPTLTGRADSRDESQASALPRGVIVHPLPRTTSLGLEHAMEISDAVIFLAAIVLGVFTVRLAFRERADDPRWRH